MLVLELIGECIRFLDEVVFSMQVWVNNTDLQPFGTGASHSMKSVDYAICGIS